MRWTPKGFIYTAKGDGWAQSHATAPTPLMLNDKCMRIYCAFCDHNNISRIGYVDVNADDPSQILGMSDHPLLDIGRSGDFDDHGVIPTSIVAHDEKLYLYYLGFQLQGDCPYRILSGLAVSNNQGQTFSRYTKQPLLPTTTNEAYLRSAPSVIKDGPIWKMWYVSGNSWMSHNNKQLPVYTIRYIESEDGLNWPGEGQPCFEHAEGEFGFGRPYVIKCGNTYQLYYSIRRLSNGYRLGYAESKDGKNWIRLDHQVDIQPSADGWDSESVCYSAAIDHKKRQYLFYNGNGYGKTGFGYAQHLTPSKTTPTSP